MKKIFLNSFAALVTKKSEAGLSNAIQRLAEVHDAPFWYSRIRPGVRRFFVNGCDRSIIESLIDKLSQVVPITPFQKNDCSNSQIVLKKMNEMSFSFLDSKSLIKPFKKSILFEGVELDVNPDALIIWEEADGNKHVGAIKTKLKKSFFDKAEATMIACMLRYYLIKLFPDYIVDPEYCICYDAFRSKLYQADNYTKNVIVATAIAKRIARMEHVAA